MRPVDTRWAVSQNFGEGATAGVPANANPSSGTGYLVYLYGNYQPYGHAGTDIACPVGTPVRAARSGTVLWCDWDVHLPGDDSWGPSGYFRRWAFYKAFGGRLLVVQHAPGDLDVYAHLSAWKVKAGQFVNEGDLVALSGDSSGGRDGVLGPHLHTERIVDLNYSTGNGEIYGRIDPTTVWGGIAAHGTTTQEDTELSAAEVKEIKEYIHALLIGGYTSGGRQHPGIGMVVEENQRRIDATPAKTANAFLDTPINRAGGTRTGVTTPRATFSYLDSNLDAAKEAKEVK